MEERPMELIATLVVLALIEALKLLLQRHNPQHTIYIVTWINIDIAPPIIREGIFPLSSIFVSPFEFKFPFVFVSVFPIRLLTLLILLKMDLKQTLEICGNNLCSRRLYFELQSGQKAIEISASISSTSFWSSSLNRYYRLLSLPPQSHNMRIEVAWG